MSQYYTPRRTKGLFDPASKEPFRLSRSKVDLFLECPRCFYLDRRRGTARPPGFPFSLNSAVDTLLKKEFDIHRAKGSAHPLMEAYSIDAVPFADSRMDEWRDALRRGITYLDPSTNFLLTGGIDDIWINPAGELIVVDYKATSKNGELSIDAEWQMGYKRQIEFYQWLLRRNGFKVSRTGYFVYCNGLTDKKAFDRKLEFNVQVIPYEGDDSWVAPTIEKIRECLEGEEVPEPSKTCDWCNYVHALREF